MAGQDTGGEGWPKSLVIVVIFNSSSVVAAVVIVIAVVVIVLVVNRQGFEAKVAGHPWPGFEAQARGTSLARL